MQATTQSSAIVQDEHLQEPEREDGDMEVELGVNLIDAFTKQHVNFNNQVTKTRTAAAWGVSICPPAFEPDVCGLLPADCCEDGDRDDSDLDDVAQEILSKALLEDQDVVPMDVDSVAVAFPEPGGSAQEMVVFLYAFEKFRIVYA